MAGHELGCLLTSKRDLGRKGGPGSRLDGWGVEAGGGEGAGRGGNGREEGRQREEAGEGETGRRPQTCWILSLGVLGI